MNKIKVFAVLFTLLAQICGGLLAFMPVGAVSEGDLDGDLPQPNLKIAKIQIEDTVAGVIFGADEYVEIYNSSEMEVDLKGLKVVFYSGSKVEGEDPTRTLVKIDKDWLLGGFGSVIFSYNGYLSDKSDGFFVDNYAGGSLAKGGGAVRMLQNGQALDTVGYGSAKIFESKKIGGSLGAVFGRCVDLDGFMTDTDNNFDDFSDASGLSLGEYAKCEGFAEEDDVSDGDDLEEDLPDEAENACLGLKLNEIGANLATEKQFVEVKNTGTSVLDLDGCQIATSKSKVVYAFGSISLEAGEILAVNPNTQGLKIIKTTTDVVYLRDSSGAITDAVAYENMKSGTSLALLWVGGEWVWVQTFVLTPDEENIFEQYARCSVGYERNLETGRCVKIKVETTVAEAKTCAENQFLNPETGRCKKIEVVTEKTCDEGQFLNPETNRCKKIPAPVVEKVCAENQFLNLETNRCKKIATTVTSLCAEGYERNPETNRCRKIRENLGAGFTVDSDKSSDGGSLGALICLGLVVLVGLGYLVFSFKMEIGKFCGKIYTYMRDLVRKIRILGANTGA
ncbi:MAG: lamin tail domain-containing protein [Candidatus Nomurabacteria bacterium]|jgi:hypothetical protein|nr:lamin tail domain-containing protein [Candidatus Nomurabacteria bacterium]